MERTVLPSNDVMLPNLPAGWKLVTAAVLGDGALALLGTNAGLTDEFSPDVNGGSLGKPVSVTRRSEARLWRFDGETLLDGPTFPLESPFPQIDQFSDGRWLVVARRTAGEQNARVLSADGELLGCFMLGDGVEHVGIDQRDQIWVGWFDEGIYGNEQWRVAGQEWPLSSRGVGVFAADGTYRLLSAFPEEAGIFVDCYALNVTDEGVWACPYVDFPLLQLRLDCPARWWSSTFDGPTALAVSDSHALLAGGWSADADQLVLVALEGEGNGDPARVLATWHLPLAPRLPQPDEPPDFAVYQVWERPTLLTGRGDMIHLVQDEVWHRWRVSEALKFAS